VNRKKKLLASLKKQIKKSSMNKVAKELGYSSHNTIAHWLKTENIPNHAMKNVETTFGETK